ncbi:MAG: ribulose phosphate epimerase [Nannocystaceae bacterium]
MHGRRFGSRLIPLGLAAALVACDSRVLPEADAGSSGPGSAAASTTGGDVEPASTTAPTPTPATTTASVDPPGTSSGTGSAEAETGEPGCEFLCPGDAGSTWAECDVWQQDCPEDEKCAPWANDGGNSWNATRCVPVDASPDAPGDPCTVEGSGVSGIDSCEAGVMCWDVDSETNEGTCVPLCVGDATTPTCADPGRTCTISGDGILNLCLQLCDPLEPMPCPEKDGCYPIYGGFVCAPVASFDGGGTFEPCEYITACQPGLVCANPEAVGQCGDGLAGCCTPVCDVQAPNCPEPTVCVPWYDDGGAPPGYEDVGACLVPQK